MLRQLLLCSFDLSSVLATKRDVIHIDRCYDSSFGVGLQEDKDGVVVGDCVL